MTCFRAKARILNIRIQFEFVRNDYCDLILKIIVKIADTSVLLYTAA